jgi:transposase, IS5 family
MVINLPVFEHKSTEILQIFAMKPQPSPQAIERQKELFRSELEQIIDTKHPMVKLAKTVDWGRLETLFGATFHPEVGRPGISTRLMVSLHYLKYMQNLSDEDVVQLWVENPYWQYLSGMQFFTHKAPIDPSSMTRWRHRVGESGAEELLQETIVAGLKLKAVKTSQLSRVNKTLA